MVQWDNLNDMGAEQMKIIVIDGQGGGVGKMLTEKLKTRLPDQPVMALGTNAMATAGMLRAGADQGATGESAIIYNCRDADIILGPIGIVLAYSMLGELSPAMAQAVGESRAVRILIPVGKCRTKIAGAGEIPLGAAMDSAVDEVCRLLGRE